MEENIKALENPVFPKISAIVDRLGVEAYVVGGYVRDYYLRRPSTDIDVVVVGSGIEVAERIYERHTILTHFLESLGVSHETAVSDACKMEHIISDEAFWAIKKSVGEKT